MSRVLRCGPLIGVVMLVAACGPERATAPSAVSAPPASAVPAAPVRAQPPAPVPSGEPVATYTFSSPLDYPVHPFTVRSEYRLYGNGVFGLSYDAFEHVYLGTYQQEDAVITFRFGSASSDADTAIGMIKGDLLEVRYSEMMQHSDFENAVYRRSR